MQTQSASNISPLYSPAREKSFTKKNITAGWAACGLFLFNLDRVLRVTPKPPAQSSVPRADEIKVGSCHQDEVPQTPVTPVSAEGLASLHNLIKQDAYTLDGTSIQRLERHVQKLANAAQISYPCVCDVSVRLRGAQPSRTGVARSSTSVFSP